MPTRDELIATGRSEDEIAREIGADALIYQDLDALKRAIARGQPEARRASRPRASTAIYVTGDVTADYLSQLAAVRDEARGESDELLLEEENRRDSTAALVLTPSRASRILVAAPI